MKQKDVQPHGTRYRSAPHSGRPGAQLRAEFGQDRVFDAPGGFGVRVDSHVRAGYTVPPYYDSLLAKILVYAPTRDEAIARMERALQETRLEGVATTQPFHLKILANEYFRRGEVATDFLQRRMTNGK
jgi:acetyl-CoA carboxylase biotin carboxylase subunit